MSITVKELIRRLYEFNPDYMVEIFVLPRNPYDRQESYEVDEEDIDVSEEGECINITV